jgi:hypothetical protein
MRPIAFPLLCAAVMAAAVPAQARVFGVAVSGDGARIELHDQAGPCVGQARLAEHISRNGDKVPGCWLVAEGAVKVSFLDGERGTIPLAHVRKVSEN